MKKKLPISVFELIVYIGVGLLALWGVIYMILGFACNFIDYKTDLYIADQHLKDTTAGMGFLKQGILIFTIAAVFIVIVLLVTAKKTDREFEKTQRRAARMSQRFNNQPEIVDAEMKEASDKE